MRRGRPGVCQHGDGPRHEDEDGSPARALPKRGQHLIGAAGRRPPAWVAGRLDVDAGADLRGVPRDRAWSLDVRHRAWVRQGWGEAELVAQLAGRLVAAPGTEAEVHEQTTVRAAVVEILAEVERAEPERARRQVEVLRDVPGLQQCEAVAAVGVLERDPLEPRGEKHEHRCVVGDGALHETGRDLARHVVRTQVAQLVADRVVVVQPVHPRGVHVQFQRIQPTR